MQTCFSAAIIVVQILWTTCSSYVNHSTNSRKVSGDYCERDVFHAECTTPDEVLLITSALYGRMRHSRCVSTSPVGCYVDVLKLLAVKCSARRRCQVTVASLVPDQSQPCHADYRSYLEASYTCIKVVGSVDSPCQQQHPGGAVTQTVDVSDELPRYLSSYMTQQTSCGSFDSPLRLLGPVGRRLVIYLLDFTSHDTATSRSTATDTCQVYAVLREDWTTGGGHTVCAGSSDIADAGLIYTSSSNVVEARLVTQTTRQLAAQFLIKVELIGCADPPLPRHAAMRREDDTVTIWCNITSLSDDEQHQLQWQLRCDGARWIGTQYNCSTVTGVPAVSSVLVDWYYINGKTGGAVLMMLSIAFIIGLVMVICGAVYLHRLRSRRHW